MDIKAIQQKLAQFAKERDWEQFHSPKNLAIALSVEASELLEPFQWLKEEESHNLGTNDMMCVREEIADVLIYLLRLSDLLGIDLEACVDEKMRLNAEKYPIDLAKGNAVKYNRRNI